MTKAEEEAEWETYVDQRNQQAMAAAKTAAA